MARDVLMERRVAQAGALQARSTAVDTVLGSLLHNRTVAPKMLALLHARSRASAPNLWRFMSLWVHRYILRPPSLKRARKSQVEARGEGRVGGPRADTARVRSV